MGRRYRGSQGSKSRPRSAGMWFRYWWEQNAPQPGLRLESGLVTLLHVGSGRMLVVSAARVEEEVRKLFHGRKVPALYLGGLNQDVEGPLAQDYREFEVLALESRQARLAEHVQNHGRSARVPYVPRDGDFAFAEPPPSSTPVHLVVGRGLHRLWGRAVFARLAALRQERVQDYLSRKEEELPPEDREHRAALRRNKHQRSYTTFHAAESEYNRVYAEVRNKPETYTLGDLHRDYPESGRPQAQAAPPSVP